MKRAVQLIGAVTSAVVATGLLSPAGASAQDTPAETPSAPVSAESPETANDGPVTPAAGAEALSGRAELNGRRAGRTVVDTPSRGEITILRLIVSAKSKPAITVSAVGKRAGTKRVTVVGGVKRLPGTRSSKKLYAVTTPIIKPRVSGARSRVGRLAINVSAPNLKVISRKVNAKTFSRRVSGEMCKRVSAFDISNSHRKTRVAFDSRVLFGPQLTGFGHPQYIGSFAVLKACTGKAPQSFTNLVTGRTSRALNTRSLTADGRSAAVDTSAGSTDAVVLVSGFFSTTPFTTPGRVCSASDMSAGGTWYAMQTALSASGFPVYTAPAAVYTYGVPNAPVPVAITPSTMGMGSCDQPQLPSSMTMNTAGDFDLNSSILAGYLNYLNVNFGVEKIWLVGHSDGGLWSRGAMDYASFMPGIEIQSVTTIDTPYTGSFLADAGKDLVIDPCPSFDLVCDAKKDALEDLLDHFAPALDQGDALLEMTATNMAAWNSRLAGIPGATPFYASSAIGLNDPDTFNLISSGAGSDPYSNPNDVAVGLSSQQGDGLVANGTIAVLSCFPTIPGLHTEVPGDLVSAAQDVDLINTYPTRTAASEAVTINPMNIAYVTDSLNGAPNTSACPSAGYQQSGQYLPGQFGSWPDN